MRNSNAESSHNLASNTFHPGTTVVQRSHTQIPKSSLQYMTRQRRRRRRRYLRSPSLLPRARPHAPRSMDGQRTNEAPTVPTIHTSKSSTGTVQSRMSSGCRQHDVTGTNEIDAYWSVGTVQQRPVSCVCVTRHSSTQFSPTCNQPPSTNKRTSTRSTYTQVSYSASVDIASQLTKPCLGSWQTVPHPRPHHPAAEDIRKVSAARLTPQARPAQRRAACS